MNLWKLTLRGHLNTDVQAGLELFAHENNALTARPQVKFLFRRQKRVQFCEFYIDITDSKYPNGLNKALYLYSVYAKFEEKLQNFSGDRHGIRMFGYFPIYHPPEKLWLGLGLGLGLLGLFRVRVRVRAIRATLTLIALIALIALTLILKLTLIFLGVINRKVVPIHVCMPKKKKNCGMSFHFTNKYFDKI